MKDRPTYASVTAEPCTCKYLANAADDPRIPIFFDERTHEYQYTYQESECSGLSTLVIYHCPFCGGTAPASKRHLLFHVIPHEEEDRLAAMLSPIRTIREALERLGSPDHDDPQGEIRREQETDESPSSMRWFRALTYRCLSSAADVRITERDDGTVYTVLQGKPIGDPAAGTAG
jgi:hypothetical protein